ncbi:YheC/YheD family protein [Paenibacillus sp. sptzw28]|uniref:YheC/YheD family endospore coat-associated protein n=1 Tax=Paenibacillus sp. sptzw28 TaxID=715179 RepID=UPI001C6E1A80|nr:YheC/YheD family protein [Paenibacillus sp. sptzw28]QYR22936.1 YheC/YheD family protein [Paenibacillus sp. sptzw28]
MDLSEKLSSSKQTVVGVLLGPKLIRIILQTKQSIDRIQQLVEANKEANTNLNFFSRKDINLASRTVSGTFFNFSGNRWERRTMPLPDVIYVRGGSGQKVAKLITTLERMGVKRINPIVAFNKGNLFEELIRDQEVSPYIPATVSVKEMAEIRTMIRKHEKVYVKARIGRKGTKVMRIEKLSAGGYRYSYSILGDLVRKKVQSMQRLEQVINRFFGGREVIVQQAIDLARVDRGRLCDFRAEVQRNKKGEIEIVGISIRVGQRNSPITTHGEAFRYDTYLSTLFPDYSEAQLVTLKQKINSFLMTVYAGVEKKYGKFGEIGIDFAVDRQGKIWLIECNAQSAKVSIGKAYGELARRAFLNPLEYAKLIAGGGIRTSRGSGSSGSQSASGSSRTTGSRSASGSSRTTGSESASGSSRTTGSRSASGSSRTTGSRSASGSSRTTGSRSASGSSRTTGSRSASGSSRTTGSRSASGSSRTTGSQSASGSSRTTGSESASGSSRTTGSRSASGSSTSGSTRTSGAPRTSGGSSGRRSNS